MTRKFVFVKISEVTVKVAGTSNLLSTFLGGKKLFSWFGKGPKNCAKKMATEVENFQHPTI